MIEDDDLRASDGRVPGRRGLATRQRLLDQTASLLRDRPYPEVTVVEIAKAAGTSPATFYQYFPDVEAAVLVLAERAVTEGGRLRELASGTWHGRAGLATAESLVDAFFDIWNQHAPVLRVVDLATSQGDDRFREVRGTILAAVADVLTDVVGAQVAKGRIPADTDPRTQAGMMVATLAHISDRLMGFEFWGIAKDDLHRSLTRQLYWTVTGTKPPVG